MIFTFSGCKISLELNSPIEIEASSLDEAEFKAKEILRAWGEEESSSLPYAAIEANEINPQK